MAIYGKMTRTLKRKRKTVEKNYCEICGRSAKGERESDRERQREGEIAKT